MAEWTGDLSDQIFKKIAIACNFAVASVASRMAISIYDGQKETPEAKSKKEIFDKVAKAFNAALCEFGTDVSVVADSGDGRGIVIQVGTKSPV